MQFTLIAAVDSEWGLSREDKLPWRHTKEGRDDMQWFTRITGRAGSGDTSAIIMGRKTWESIRNRPLKGRVNVVVSRANRGTTIEGALTKSPVVHVSSFEAAIMWTTEALRTRALQITRCYVIGGAMIYQQALRSPYLAAAYITKIPGDHDCDLCFPRELLPPAPTDTRRLKRVCVEMYSFRNTAEQAYLDLIARLLRASTRPNRTGINTRSLFHASLRFGLADARGRVLPLLTTKRVWWPAIYHELIWFLRGSTDIAYLAANGIRIWDGNSSAEFLAKCKLDYAPGTVGPVYGWQWRNFGGKWPKEVQAGVLTGRDQLADVIELLRQDPWTRRAVVSAWNPTDIPAMALPPCHYSYQFVVEPAVDGNPMLNCIANMRSADVPLGVPFNIASYALLTHIVSHIVGIAPGELVISMADCHIYETHVAACETLIERVPRRFPTLTFGPAILQTASPSIDNFANDFAIGDYIIEDYAPHPRIRMDMVA